MKNLIVLGIILLCLGGVVNATLASDAAANHLVKGNKLANVTIVEIASYDVQDVVVAESIIETLMSEYSGKIKFAFRAFPDDEKWLGDWLAAEAVECARDQGRFWEYRAVLLRDKPEFDYDSLYKAAYGIVGSMSKFRACINQRNKKEQFIMETTEFAKMKIAKQPLFFVNNERFDGLPKYAELKETVEYELAQARCGNGEIDEYENCKTCPKDAVCELGEECVEKKCVPIAVEEIGEKSEVIGEEGKISGETAKEKMKIDGGIGKDSEEEKIDKEIGKGNLETRGFEFAELLTKKFILSVILGIVGILQITGFLKFRKGKFKIKINNKEFYLGSYYLLISGVLFVLAAVGIFWLA